MTGVNLLIFLNRTRPPRMPASTSAWLPTLAARSTRTWPWTSRSHHQKQLYQQQQQLLLRKNRGLRWQLQPQLQLSEKNLKRKWPEKSRKPRFHRRRAASCLRCLRLARLLRRRQRRRRVNKLASSGRRGRRASFFSAPCRAPRMSMFNGKRH